MGEVDDGLALIFMLNHPELYDIEVIPIFHKIH